MELVTFAEVNETFAKDQPQYYPFPAWKNKGDMRGQIVGCWKLSFKERVKILIAGRIWHSILTFNHPLQPQMLWVDKPEMKLYREDGGEIK